MERQAAAERAAAERVAAERAAAERVAAERAAAERVAAERVAAEKVAAEQAEAARLAAAAERPVFAGIPANLAREIGIPALATARVAERLTLKSKQWIRQRRQKSTSLQIDLLSWRAYAEGEGPWQSAERILAADGKKHSVDEVRALTKAIQAAYKMDNNSSDMSGLKVKYNFATKSEQTFNNIINNCKDDKVRALLISLAKS